MSLLCEKCGYVYDWEMFFNNHMRIVHGVKVSNSRQGALPLHIKTFLNYYYYHICEKPSLEEIKELSEDLEVKKEQIYWWFFNQRRKRFKDGEKAKRHEGKVSPSRRLVKTVRGGKETEKRKSAKNNDVGRGIGKCKGFVAKVANEMK